MSGNIVKPRGSSASIRPVNTDGKGANGLMLDWYSSEPRGVTAKNMRQILTEYFTSMLVLSARFSYRPAPGTFNYLYLVDGQWQLSLIAPDEWSEQRRRGFAGTCTLQPDMTWTITPSDRLREAGPVADAIGRFYDAFASMLDTDLTLEEILPFHVGRLPYYQRLYASALSRSIRASTVLGRQSGIPSHHWLDALPTEGQARSLLGRADGTPPSDDRHHD